MAATTDRLARIFDPSSAIRVANDEVERVAAEKQAQLTEEKDAAIAAATAYAKHLAEGGDPTVAEGAEGQWSSGWLISPNVGLRAVYEAWNAARGVRNPVEPFLPQRVPKWAVAETLLASVGTPVLFSELPVTATEVAQVLKRLVVANENLVPRKTKVKGKVAYYVRERRDDDKDTVRDGRYSLYDIPEEK